MQSTLLIIDGNSILNRAFFGVRPLSNAEGFPTNALFGLLNMVSRQLEAVRPDYFAVAFDVHAPTFRHKMYDEYKAGRRPTPPELLAQFPVAKEFLQAMGAHLFEKEGYEADDILGTIAALADRKEGQVLSYIFTGDRDSLQLISPYTHVLLATNKETVDYSEERFLEEKGVRSTQFVDVKALMGDSSDHIPGVPGIGEKTAFDLIARYRTLDDIYEKIDTLEAKPSVLAKLKEGKDSAYLSRNLSRIDCAVPLGIELEDLRSPGMDKAKMYRLCLKYEFQGFIHKFGLSASDLEPSDEKPEGEAPVLETRDSRVEDLPDLGPDSRVFLYFGEDTVEVSLGQNVLYRIAETEEQLRLLAAYMEGRPVVLYDAKEEYKRLDRAGVRYRSCAFDVMLAAYVADSGYGKYTLDQLVLQYLGRETSKDRSPAYELFLLYGPLEEKLRSSGQEKVFYEIEMPLCGVLADMEQIGFAVDTAGISAFGDRLFAEEKRLEEEIYGLAGCTFNTNSPKQLGEVLFEKLQLPALKKSKGKYTTSAEVLEMLRPYHPIVDKILEYRQVAKLHSTYAEGLLKVTDSQGRIHTTFRQTGTATGRLSSAEPNLQNIPIKTELGREFRKYFIPMGKGRVLIDADYSQIELRLLAALSGDENMIESFLSGKDIHTSTASQVFHVPPEEVTIALRKQAKAINFGIMYGMGEHSLSEDLHITRKEAKAYIDHYLQTYPDIDRFRKATIAFAYENGYVTTLFGRRRYIPELSGSNKMLKHFGERVAMNSPIQGTAADLIKKAMIAVHEKLRQLGLDAYLVMQVHDELILDASEKDAPKAMEVLKEEMEHVFQLPVPLEADAKSGSTWYECH